MRPAALLAVLTAGAAVAWIAACAAVPSDARIGIDGPSAADDQFGPVADFLDHRCGSLDCHGQIGRNFRVWGCEGMRLDPGDYPQCSPVAPLDGRLTTADEHLETYRSLVGLEPAVMSYVISTHAQNPELLTFVRKARGEESHKGGKLITPGDPQDLCIIGWLTGDTDAGTCQTATNTYPKFPVLDASTE